MMIGRVERFLVGAVVLCVTLAIGLQAAAFIQASFGQVAAALEVIGKQGVR